jgi:hypothetical protein
VGCVGCLFVVCLFIIWLTLPLRMLSGRHLHRIYTLSLKAIKKFVVQLSNLHVQLSPTHMVSVVVGI